MGDVKTCRELVYAGSWSPGRTCPNKAKYGDYCGTHSPEQQEKRRKARRPTDFERRAAASDRERQRVKALERVLETARIFNDSLAHDGSGALDTDIAAYDKLMEDEP